MTAILPQSFFILSCVGLWRPVEWQGWKRILYNAYSCFIVFTNFVFTLTEFLDLILASETVNEFTNNLSMMLAMVAGCGKVIGVLCNHRIIAYVVQLLNQKPFILLNLYESNIKKKYISIYSFVIRFYFMFFTAGVTGVMFIKISITEFPNVLPYRGWFPYNYSRPNIFIITAAHQLLTIVINAYVHVAFDTLFLGMMMYVSIQVNVLQYRFQYIVKTIVKFNARNQNGDEGNSPDKKLIAEWVDHHNDVLSLSDYVHRIFSGSIFFQYCLSSTQICVTAYAMSSISVFSIEFISGIVFLLGTTLQIFVLCMAAHQVTLKT
ncbi:odorant receptor Or1-like isoform X2 [Microplitis mediator]|uniref:odorant receptor Or1-like isoform X2 n=1 Tax=Microplitis mediator TaxID=375433 RepID=UPI0025521B54|nr:odorant receptor Or1-like isoform X2 [Microplitis mediator]